MTEKEFLEFYTGHYGEKLDNLNQVVSHCFTGHELFEFVNEAMKAGKEIEQCNHHFPRLYTTGQRLPCEFCGKVSHP
jgi:hypothetical protein